MKALSKVGAQALESAGDKPKPLGSVVDRGTNKAEVDIVAYVFSRLVVIYPGWKNAVVGNPVKWASRYRDQLLKSLKQAGIKTEAAIERGLSEAGSQSSDFLPNPGRFANWCKPLRSHPSHQLFRDQNALPHKGARPEFAQGAIADILKDLKGGGSG